MILCIYILFLDNQVSCMKQLGVSMESANTKESKAAYPKGSRLLIYKLLLDVLYQQNLISKGTFNKSVQHVERAVESRLKGQ